uniref:CdvA-like coiled-coil domain-containing protein n=1 Tax=Fervidicoccus fontis TaxID=683846 RepID=A0A7J3ZLJ9_9CREN
MIIYTVDMIEKYIGQKVKDPYDRTIGTLTSVYSDVDGVVNAVEILLGDSVFKTFEARMLTIKNGELVLLPEWKFKSMKIIEKLERGRRRARALEDLYSKGEIPKHTYDEFKAKLTRDLERLKGEAKEVKELIRKRIHELEDQIVQAEKALTALKVSYIAGEIGERGYKPAVDILRQGRDRNLEEKSDAKRVLELIQRLEAAGVELEWEQEERALEKVEEGESIVGEPLYVEVVQDTAKSEA